MRIIRCVCGKVLLDDWRAIEVQGWSTCSVECAARLVAVNEAFPNDYAPYRSDWKRENMPTSMEHRIQ